MISLSAQKSDSTRTDLIDCIGMLESECQKYGFIDFVKTDHAWAKLLEFSSDLDKNWQQLAIVGIGGSSQGIKSLVQSIDPEQFDDKKIIVFDHIDGKSIRRNLKKIVEVEETLWCVISKSGSTSETLILLSAIRDHLSFLKIKPFRKVLVITEHLDSPIGKWAKSVNATTYEFPQNIEGRFSILSPATLLPASLLGFDIELLKTGALWALNQKTLLAQISNFYLESFENEKWISNFWFYSSTMTDFGKWLEQLWAESLGKCQEDSGLRVSTPNCCIGTNDQHSVLQQMAQGFPDRSHCFINFKDGESFSISTALSDNCEKYIGYTTNDLLNLYAQSTFESLRHKNPCLKIECDSLNLQTIGALYMLFEMVVAIIGKFKGIEIYGQPGVEESKIIFKKLL